MIGHIERAADQGRTDARQGFKAERRSMSSCTWTAYHHAWKRETQRMRMVGELPQTVMGLQCERAVGRINVADRDALV